MFWGSFGYNVMLFILIVIFLIEYLFNNFYEEINRFEYYIKV